MLRQKPDSKGLSDYNTSTPTQEYSRKAMNDVKILSPHRGPAYGPLWSQPRWGHNSLRLFSFHAKLRQHAALIEKSDCCSSSYGRTTRIRLKNLEFKRMKTGPITAPFCEELTLILKELLDEYRWSRVTRWNYCLHTWYRDQNHRSCQKQKLIVLPPSYCRIKDDNLTYFREDVKLHVS